MSRSDDAKQKTFISISEMQITAALFTLLTLIVILAGIADFYLRRLAEEIVAQKNARDGIGQQFVIPGGYGTTLPLSPPPSYDYSSYGSAEPEVVKNAIDQMATPASSMPIAITEFGTETIIASGTHSFAVKIVPGIKLFQSGSKYTFFMQNRAKYLTLMANCTPEGWTALVLDNWTVKKKIGDATDEEIAKLIEETFSLAK